MATVIHNDRNDDMNGSRAWIWIVVAIVIILLAALAFGMVDRQEDGLQSPQPTDNSFGGGIDDDGRSSVAPSERFVPSVSPLTSPTPTRSPSPVVD